MVDIRDGGPWRPTAAEGDRVEDLALNEVIGQALGTASMCWADVGSAGEFDSVRASWVLDGVMAHVNAVIDRVIAGTTRAVGPAPPVAGDAVRAAAIHQDEPVAEATSAAGQTLNPIDQDSLEGPVTFPMDEPDPAELAEQVEAFSRHSARLREAEDTSLLFGGADLDDPEVMKQARR